jgi:aryl-alcohol dehydrogenase-like predicted oxidoreductase
VPHADADNDAVLDVLMAIAEELATEPGKVAVAWVGMKGVIPIVGAKTLAQLEDNLTTSTVQLNPDQMRRLDEVSAVSLGYPHQLLGSDSVRNAVAGGLAHLIDYPRRTIA